MSTKIVQPNRNKTIIDDDKMMVSRLYEFFDALVKFAEDSPNQGAAIDDMTGAENLAQTISKVNEIISVLRSAEIIDT